MREEASREKRTSAAERAEPRRGRQGPGVGIVVLCVVAAIVALAAMPVAAAPEEAKKPRVVEAPHYGDTLFHFFQDHYFTSITTLMASQRFERVAPHDDEAEVLRGGMLLSYGMHDEAGRIFAGMIERGASPKTRDRAWFYLAKIRFQRGMNDAAGDALAKVESRLPPDLDEERGLLAAQLLMARDDYAGAAAALETMRVKTPRSRYVRYNLGVALLKLGDEARGTPLLDEIGKAWAENEEFRSLRDRANVALGFQALAGARPKEARVYLERVRLQSLQANKALLGFGWAASALKEPRLALVPWLELAGRDVSDSAALEAQIAVPYAYAELGAYGQSLARYQDAIAAFERESGGLDESIKAIRSGRFLDTLLERNPGDEMGWFWKMGELPDATELPHARHLAQVMAQHEFQEAFKNFRDLRFLSRNLTEWRDKLGTFDDMLATRRKAYADRLPQVRERASEKALGALAARRDRLAAQVAAGTEAADGVAFADPREVELLARLAQVRAALGMEAAAAGAPAPASGPTASDAASASLGAAVARAARVVDAEGATLRERARLAGGALTWQLAQAYPERRWNAQKELVQIDAGIADAARRDEALAAAERDEPVRFERFGRRIAELDPRLVALMPKVVALANEQQGLVQDLAVAELTRQKERLAVYTTQARFAVAQLYDRAYAKQESERASR